jgi:hypothetical protein
MSSFREPSEERAGGLSRRQLFLRLGGGLAGVTLASLALDVRPSPAAPPGPISLRDLLRRISVKGCDPSHGIRAALPNDHPVISLRAVARRYAGSVVDFCEPVQIAIQQTDVAGGGVTVNLTGRNFAGGGMAAIQYRSASRAADNRDFSVQAQPDGTFAQVIKLGCSAPGPVSYTLRAIDMASGRSADAAGSYVCPRPPPLTLICPAGITADDALKVGSAVVTYPDPSVTGGGGAVFVTCVPPSGTLFLVGTTTVNCTATDASGQTATCQFPITVQDV